MAIVFKVEIPLHEATNCTPEDVACTLEAIAKAVRKYDAEEIQAYHEVSELSGEYVSYGTYTLESLAKAYGIEVDSNEKVA